MSQHLPDQSDSESRPPLPSKPTPLLRKVAMALDRSVDEFFRHSREVRETLWPVGLDIYRDEFENVASPSHRKRPAGRRSRSGYAGQEKAGRSQRDLRLEAELAGTPTGPAEMAARQAFARGYCYYHGVAGLREWPAEAAKWFRKAAEQGDGDSQEYLGSMYFWGDGVEQDHAEAVRWFRMAAERGYLTSQLYLALLLLEGEGVTRDEEEALSWLEGRPVSRIQLHPGHVYYRLGMHFAGFDMEEIESRMAAASGRPQDDEDERVSKWPLAQKLFRKAAEHGVVAAFARIGWSGEAAELGYPPAQYDLAVRYRDGEDVEQDDVMARELFLEAARGGHRGAQYELALCCLDGRGGGQDDAGAACWLTRAAEGDLSDRLPVDPERIAWLDSLVLLGQLYLEGRGVRRDERMAYEAFKKAAEVEYDTAGKNALGVCFSQGIHVGQDHREAVMWFTRAAEGGNRMAMRNLALCYLHGEGAPRDRAKALDLMRRAATAWGGYADAEYDLGCLCLQQGSEAGEGEGPDVEAYLREQAESEALMWFFRAARKGHREAAEKVRELTAQFFRAQGG